jgi:hypothetical protein
MNSHCVSVADAGLAQYCVSVADAGLAQYSASRVRQACECNRMFSAILCVTVFS